MEGTTTRYRRAEPFAPTADELQAFAGRYESDEIGAVLRIEPNGDALVGRLEHSPDKALEFRPVDRDTFQLRRITIRFHRDETGKAEALELSSPSLRNIKFTLVSDRTSRR